MNVAELIEELKLLPQYYPVLCDVKMRHDETVVNAKIVNVTDMKLGPVVVLETTEDPRNYEDED